MKNLYLILVLFITGVMAQGQQVANSDMELWDDVGANNETPQNFNSFYTSTGGQSGQARQTVFREDANVHGGSHAARIESKDYTFFVFITVTVNGNLTTGRVNMGSTTATNQANHNYTDVSDADHREEFTSRPDSIAFWAHYTSGGAGGDVARVSATLHDNYAYEDPSDAASDAEWVAKAVTNFTTGGNWQRISVPFDYSGPKNNISYLLLTFASSAVPGGGEDGSVLILDDIEMMYNPTFALNNPVTETVFVSTAQGASFNIAVDATVDNVPVGASNSYTVEMSDATGSFAAPTTIGSVNSSATYESIAATVPAGTPAGSYKVRIKTSAPVVAYTDEMTVVVENPYSNIAPNATQNNMTNADGNALTVTEYLLSEVTTTEWVYATALNGPYNSFAPAQNGTTYTPNFATAGTYYVTAKSTIAGEETWSNDTVTIIVSDALSVATGMINAPIYVTAAAGKTITVPYVTSADFNAGNVFTAELSDASGSFAAPSTIGSVAAINSGDITATIPANTTSGTMYRIRVIASDPATVGSDNGADFAIYLLDINVTPSADQVIDENANGTALSLTETPTADAREWLYSTTQGGPYMSFTTPETGATYTPNFATAGTYYVTATANYGGDVFDANNEVMITVNAVANGIEDATNVALVYAYNNTIQIASELQNAQVNVYDLNGKVLSKANFSNNTTLNVNYKGIVLVQIVTAEGNYTTKVQL